MEGLCKYLGEGIPDINNELTYNDLSLGYLLIKYPKIFE